MNPYVHWQKRNPFPGSNLTIFAAFLSNVIKKINNSGFLTQNKQFEVVTLGL